MSAFPPIHPGEILSEEFLVPLGLSQTRLAIELGVPAPRINGIVRGNRAITADTTLRLGRFFGTSAELWMNLQARYELETALDSESADLARIRPLQAV